MLHRVHCVTIFIILVGSIVSEIAGNTFEDAILPPDENFWDNLCLPQQHIPYFFQNNPDLKENCELDPDCPYKKHLKTTRCWGYETTCPSDGKLRISKCDTGSPRRSRLVEREGKDRFWKRTDFGFVKERKDNIFSYCEPQSQGDSSLVCADDFKYCRGNKLEMDLKNINLTSINRFRKDILEGGGLTGRCDVKGLDAWRHLDTAPVLGTWFHELKNMVPQTDQPLLPCEVTFENPTFIIKAHSGINMYHHIADFYTLYISQHINNSFSPDISILLWHTSDHEYEDLFPEMWTVFTRNPVVMLKDLVGMKACFKDVIFTLLSRKVWTLVSDENQPSCNGSGMMQAFSQHVLHRMGVTQHGPELKRLRLTFLVRNTQYRDILNKEQIYAMLSKMYSGNSHLEILYTDYAQGMSLKKQLEITQNTDILMSIHGAGLTHMLFMPEWGAVFEMYNCEDKCYENLCRIRGLGYFTIENSEFVQAYDRDNTGDPKYVNYVIDAKEIARVVNRAIAYVQSHPAFQQAHFDKVRSHYKTKKEL